MWLSRWRRVSHRAWRIQPVEAFIVIQWDINGIYSDSMGYEWDIPSGKHTNSYGTSPIFLSGKSTISTGPFSMSLFVCLPGRVYPIPLNHYKIPLDHYKSLSISIKLTSIQWYYNDIPRTSKPWGQTSQPSGLDVVSVFIIRHLEVIPRSPGIQNGDLSSCFWWVYIGHGFMYIYMYIYVYIYMYVYIYRYI